MNYKLCHKILMAGCSDDVKTLIHEYQDMCFWMEIWKDRADFKDQEIMILKQENKFLKEDLDAI